jgi:hypothetical protein
MVEQRRANLDHRRDRRLSAFRAENAGAMSDKLQFVAG